MQTIIDAWFVQGMIKATSDAWLKGWDERNGGNLTLRLDEADIEPYAADFHAKPRYIALSQPMPTLANQPFIVTGSGKFFRNVQLDPAANLGVVKVDSDGAGYHILWGLTEDAVPTSELPAHFLSHSERIKLTGGKDRVIMHCHATNLIALTYVLENHSDLFTRKLWEGSTECLVVFPDGVGILPWMVPGTDEIGQATAETMQKHSLVLWPFHGVFGSGPTLDETFGLIDTAEKSAEVLVKVLSMGGMKQTKPYKTNSCGVKAMKTKTSLILTVAALALSGSALAEVKIALVAKSLGNGFFEAANVGAQQAAKELAAVNVIYTGPTTTTAEAQIDVLNGLIAQGVDAIAISANDPDAVVPVLKKAMQRGIKVVSWDSGVAPAGRQIHLNPSNNALIGETNVKLAADALKALNVEKGEVAVLSATPTSTNQNIWIEEMKKVLPQYPSVQLVTVAYGDDLSDKSYREAVGLLKSYPDLKVIVSPSSVGIVAAAQAVKDQGKIGKVYVTGLGLPSEMAGAIKSGASKSFAIWNPIDLGYAATYLADDLVKGTATKTEASMGKLGKVKLDAEGNGAMAEPFVYDASNIDKFSKIF